jgi:hypothetical protein
MIPFSKKRHRIYDAPAKVAVLEYLRRQEPGHHFQEGSQYELDIFCDCKFRGLHFIEVEVKEEWFGKPFPYTTVHIPERKEKWLKYDVEFWVLSRDYKRAVVVPKEHCKEKITLPYNALNDEPEDFFNVPLSICKQLVL